MKLKQFGLAIAGLGICFYAGEIFNYNLNYLMLGSYCVLYGTGFILWNLLEKKK